MSPRKGYKDPDYWQKKRAEVQRSGDAVNRVRSKAYRMKLYQLAAIHNAQNGTCASCKSPIKAAGRGRSLDQMTNKMVCQRCAIVLGVVDRSVPHLRDLITYLELHHVGR